MSKKVDKSKSKKVGLWNAFKAEAGDRCFSTRERVIKVLGIIFIPFIYGFTCIAAFWNPLAKMGSVPASIASLDQQQVLIQDYNTSDLTTADKSKNECIGIPKMWSSSNVTNISLSDSSWEPIEWSNDTSKLDQYINSSFSNGQQVFYIQTESHSVLHYNHTIPISGQPNPLGGAQLVSFMDSIMSNWQQGNLGDDFTFDSKKNTYQAYVDKGLDITNIKYHNVNDTTGPKGDFEHDASNLTEQKENNGVLTWYVKNTKDYVQISIPSDFTKILINYVDSNITSNIDTDWMDMLRSEKIGFWLTYEKSFFAAKIWDGQTAFLGAMIQKSIPSMIGTLTNIQLNEITNTIANQPLSNYQPGYSWSFAGSSTDTWSDSLTWSDHYYRPNSSSATPEYIDHNNVLITYSPNTLYTIPNEEYRAALISKTDSSLPGTSAYQINSIMTAKNPLTGAYLVPSIEGITSISDTSSDKHVWNIYDNTATPDPNSYTALLTQFTRATTIISEIPMISDTIASLIDTVANDRLSKMLQGNSNFSNYEIDFKMAMTGSTVEKLLSSDQFISSTLMQDPTYMMNDYSAPDAAFLHAKISVPILGTVEVDIPLNFGGIVALLAYPDSTTSINNYQDLSLRSLYTKDSGVGSYNNNPDPSDIPNFTKSLYADLFYGESSVLAVLLPPSDPTAVNYAFNDSSLITTSTTNPYSYLGNLLNNINVASIIVQGSINATDDNNYIDINKVGTDWSYYGMGLGQYFVCIGLYMGVLAQLVICDRKKRLRKTSCRKWYLSKQMLLGCTSIIQASVFAGSVAAIGWSIIGTAFFAQFFAMIFFGLIFVSIIGSIWFWFRDKDLGLILIIIFMVLNLACGWGTFPSFTQFPIFHYISYVLPYTYMIHMQGAIVYGVGTGTHVAAAWGNIFKYAGILLIYPAIFITIGLIMSKFRERDLLYGTWNKKKLGHVLKHTGLSKYLDYNDIKSKIDAKYAHARKMHAGNQKKLLRDKTKYDHAIQKLAKRHHQASWKRLPHDEMPQLKQAVQLIYPYKGKKSKFAVLEKDIIRDVVDFDES